MKYSCLIVLACLVSVTSNARVININARDIRGDFTMKLREMMAKATYNDTVKLYFDKGTYTVDGTIQCKGHAIMRGAGTDKTTIIIEQGKDRAAGKVFLDDTFFKFYGNIKQPISVSISDLTFMLKEHKEIWWEGMPRFAVKIYHANHVDIHNVNSYMANAEITNFDLRVCSNVTVSNCIISNYNNCKEGGNLWFRGEIHNINVHNNKFFKYGNDEAIAFFSKLVDANKALKGAVSRTNIKFTDNEIVYQHNDRLINGLTNNVLFSVLTSLGDNEHCCDTRGFEMARNKFVINDLCTRIINFQFNEVDKHSDFVIHDNEFISNPVKSDEKFIRMDFDVWDGSAAQDTIVVRNNTLTNDYAILNAVNGPGYNFLLVRGGNVLLDGNHIINRVTRTHDRKDYGIHLLWSGQEGGSVTMRNNVCKGLARILTLESGNGIGQFSLKAVNNYFQGGTSIYCSKIDRLNLDFRNNTLDCNNDNFFLQDFASKGTVVFKNNKVTVSTGNGMLMSPRSKTNTSSLRFEKLEVTGNEFHGVKNQNELTKHMTNVRKRTVKSNAYYRH
jgi:hypothetical protein